MTATGKKLSPHARRRLRRSADGAVAAMNANDRAARRNRRKLKQSLSDTWTVLTEQRAAGAHAGGGFISGSPQADAVAAATAAGTVGRGARRHGRKAKAATTSPPPKAPKSKAARRKARKHKRERRRKLVSKIPRKWKKTRGVVRLGLGLGAGVAYIGGGVAKGLSSGGRKVAGHVRSRAQERKWTPSATAQRWFSTTYTCAACLQDCASAEELNAHFLERHANEERPVRKPDAPAKLIKATTRRNSGKVAVLLPPEHTRRPRRRHAAAKKTDPARRAKTLVEKYRDSLTRIGDHAVATNGFARTVSQGFKAWGDQRPPAGGKKWTLTEIREIFAGMERALLDGVDASAVLERTFNKPGEAGGLGVHRAVTNKSFQRFRDDLATAAGDLTMIIVMIEDAYRDYIAAPLEEPNIDFENGRRSRSS